MAIAIPLLMLAGGAVAAMGAMHQAKAQSEAANYNAAISQQNAQIALDQAGAQASIQQRKATQVQGSLIAGYGAAGVTDEGSPTDVLRMSVENSALDEQAILYSGRLRSMGYVNDATLNRMAAKTAKTQGYWNAASSLLTGIGHASYGYAATAKGTPITRDLRSESLMYSEGE